LKWSDSKRVKPSGFIWALSDLRQQALVFFGALERVVGMLTVSIDLPGLASLVLHGPSGLERAL
jgi:hypothetical protein